MNLEPCCEESDSSLRFQVQNGKNNHVYNKYMKSRASSDLLQNHLLPGLWLLAQIVLAATIILSPTATSCLK